MFHGNDGRSSVASPPSANFAESAIPDSWTLSRSGCAKLRRSATKREPPSLLPPTALCSTAPGEGRSPNEVRETSAAHLQEAGVIAREAEVFALVAFGL
jgi:hypothetical protein